VKLYAANTYSDMSGIFRPGQLVTSVDWCDDPLELYAESRDVGNMSAGTVRIIGRLFPHDVALVICVARADRSAVYLLGSHGNGWVPSGLLTIVREG
jgi:hypothetical protein